MSSGISPEFSSEITSRVTTGNSPDFPSVITPGISSGIRHVVVSEILPRITSKTPPRISVVDAHLLLSQFKAMVSKTVFAGLLHSSSHQNFISDVSSGISPETPCRSSL